MASMVAEALTAGYRNIDGAQMYGNEEWMGLGIQQYLEQKTPEGPNNLNDLNDLNNSNNSNKNSSKDGEEMKLTRENLFVTSKVDDCNRQADTIRSCCVESLKKLKLTYLDLFLIHSPFDVPKEDWPDIWRAMEGLVRDGLVKDIGVSNFRIQDLECILETAEIPPTVNQVELNPCLRQPSLVEFCRKHNILVQCYAPIRVLLEKPPGSEPFLTRLAALAHIHGTESAQVLSRWSLQRGNAVVTTTTNPGRLVSNLDCLSFDLSEEELTEVEVLGDKTPFRKFWSGKDFD